ncbi:MAG TPA: YqgE/AlgH family protein [Bacteroidales bacterium]|nr:YqgE/AlgH family protein [Bacteroidales bacterium]HSA44067.1 YqgE/AlgH family protein [Bacteroidales bacterium]
MQTGILKPSAGRILISEPSLRDFYFRRSVVLLAEHNDEGSFGLIINKPIHLSLREVVKGFPDFDARVFLGGPVKTDSLFFLHTRDDLIRSGLKVIEGLFWGGDIEQVKELMLSRLILPSEIRFYVGYSGWAPRQLDEEMERNSWVVSRASKDEVIGSEPEQIYPDALRKLGGDYLLWTNFPNDPSLN